MLSAESELPFLAFAFDADEDELAGLDLAEEDPLGEGVFDLSLDRATQGTRTQDRVEAKIGEEFACFVAELQAHILGLHALGEPRDHEVDDLLDLVLAQRREDDRVVHAVEELGAEVLFEFLVDLRLHPRVVVRQIVRRLEAREDSLVDIARAKVRRHDDDGVLERQRGARRCAFLRTRTCRAG